ncbi:MAG TPA: MFS transporter [Anaerolineales bacterium]|nr:MFS transporter [Anaerolineales bacterium]
MNISSHQDNSRFAANIPRYFVYTALKGFGFGLITAMWLIYLQQRRGLSLTQATFVDVAFWIAAVLGEVPTGIVADTFGRKTSLAVGVALMSLSIFAWAIAPTVPLIVLAYAGLAIGVTFLSGAEDAFFFESIQITGRANSYTHLVGLAGATMLGATALGSAASGLFASVDLILPFLIAGISLLATLGIVLTFKEPQIENKLDGRPRKSYAEILRQSFALMRARPTLRSPMLYLALVPMAALVMETFFLQPQAVALGVPIAGIGILVMATQFINMAGSTWADRIAGRLGEGRILYLTPAIIVISLVLLAVFQLLFSLLWIAVISFATAVLRPIVLNRIQNQVSDNVRATILSMQSLLATMLLAVSEPILGVMADRSGLPAAYFTLAAGLGILVLLLFWTSSQHLLLPEVVEPHQSEVEV